MTDSLLEDTHGMTKTSQARSVTLGVKQLDFHILYWKGHVVNRYSWTPMRRGTWKMMSLLKPGESSLCLPLCRV